MTQYAPVPVPAVPPKGPLVNLIDSSIKPSAESDPPTIAYPDGSQIALFPEGLRAELAARRSGPGGSAAWIQGITYAPESHAAAQLRDRCDGATVDQPALPAPGGLVLAPIVGGGTVSAAAHQYRVTAINDNGETTALAPVSITLGAIGQVVLTWDKVADNAQYGIYGRTSGSVGLLTTVGPFDDDEPATWTDNGSLAPGAAPPSSNTTGGPGPYGNLDNIVAIPYIVLVEDSCSSFGFQERDFKGRALRLLDNATPQAVEKEWWTGTIAQAKGYPNRYLADDNCQDLTPGTVPSVDRAKQILQNALQQCGFGGQGMLHVQAQTTPSLVRVRRVGAYMLDEFDNVVVPGVGYPGTGPGGDDPGEGFAWMFASDMVMVRLEEAGTVFPDTFAEALDRGQAGQPNTITFRAERFAVAYADMACQFACKCQLDT